MISFAVTPSEKKLIARIVDRAATIVKEIGTEPMDKLQVTMSLTACHANGCPLRLEDLSQADDFNLLHDVSGIHNTISRKTGRIEGHFLPRFAAK